MGKLKALLRILLAPCPLPPGLDVAPKSPKVTVSFEPVPPREETSTTGGD